MQLRQCRRLALRLDFTGVDSSHFPIHFQSIEQLDIDYITFEPLYQVMNPIGSVQMVAVYRAQSYKGLTIVNFYGCKVALTLVHMQIFSF